MTSPLETLKPKAPSNDSYDNYIDFSEKILTCTKC